MQSSTAPRQQRRPVAPGTVPRGLGGILARAVRDAGSRLFRREDEFALRHGWSIEIRRGGLSRSYRDPRFDALIACLLCAGAGVCCDEACSGCGGTGRVVLGALRLVEQRSRA